MHPRPPSWPNVCWECQWRRLPRQATYVRDRVASTPVPQLTRRAFHTTQPRSKPALTSAGPSSAITPALLGASPQQQQQQQQQQQKPQPIRERLQLWQHEHGGPDEEALKAFANYPARGDIQNGLSVLSHGAKSDDDYRDNEIEGDQDNEGEDLVTIGLFLKPGDVVELSQPGREPVLAVFVQQFDTRSQFFSINGKWCHTILSKISFAIPGCIDPALIQPLIPYLPTKPGEASAKVDIHVPRQLGAPVMQVLQRMTEESERIYRKNAPVLDTAYSVLADQSRTRMMSLAQIAKTLLGRTDPAWTPSSAALLAVRKALHHNEFRFRSDPRSQRLTNVFAIRPKDDVKVVETVQDWIREYNEHKALNTNPITDGGAKRTKGASYVAEFVEKTRRLIAISRKHREPNQGCIGPSKTRYVVNDRSAAMRTVWGKEFTDADQQIINFLQAWVLTGQFIFMPSLHASCASILHATGCYEGSIQNRPEGKDRMGRSMGHLFLQEIGVITPHENRLLYDEQLMLPTVRLSRNLELLTRKAEFTRRSPDFRDSLAELRRDWGTTNVYCIDGVGANEIVDGVSISKVKGEKSQYWVHVHVANPTAFFDKTHVLSGLAAHMTETVYTPERSFPMLPPWATQNYFSLDRNRPVLTFSTRVDLSGNFLETKIEPGVIRKTISITPTELSKYLGENTESEVIRLVVGGQVPPTKTSRTTPKLSPSQLQELRDLYAVARALWERRKAAGGVRFGTKRVDVRLFEKSGEAGLAWTPPSVHRARLIHGDPIIEVTAQAAENSSQQSVDSSNIVEEIMMLACQSAASWCAERDIPVMYRGTVESPFSGIQSLEQFRHEVVNPYIQKHGRLSLSLGSSYLRALGRSIVHSSPLPHKIIGAESYLKVTSPLRRFSDMIAHWQIEAALRYEARTGRKFNADAMKGASRPILPFLQKQMQESIITLSPREKIISLTKRDSNHFWVVHAFMRAFYYKEAPLPNTFKVWLRDDREGEPTAYGYLSDYSIQIEMIKLPGLDIMIGDEWETELYSVQLFDRRIFVKPIRLLKREMITPIN